MGRLLIPACAAATLLLAQLARADEFDLSVDLRAVSTDATATRLTGGLGKLRYDEQHDGLRLGYVRLGYRGDVTQTLRVAVEAFAYGDHDVNAAGGEIKCSRQADGTGADDEHRGSQLGQLAPSIEYR